ncbi:cyclic nucleotide-binding domain-containing protein [Colletotrichum zoysiae]|uniref:Cyclic nucleotide-binding domain-containing protein n=1 Tax=Colletotrichum zoysiae TaxID=1216348 RepID=A0AAD9LWZ9_9PEZI|nr:cyclic nucleotide-binding domain-containing protein [Colletotrichum zoysiae]
MRRNRSPTSPSPYRALAHGAGVGGVPDSISLLRSFNVDTNPTRPMRPSPLTASTIRDMPLDLVDRIRSFPLFVSAPDEFLAAIGNHLRPQVHAAQDHILTEGDDARAMYWLVRGVVAVTSRDGEAIYAELKPGAFFGEIGVLMDIPRTATIVARTKCLLVVLKKEDLQAELPKFPDMERAIRHEAQERLNILKKKRQEGGHATKPPSTLVNGAREPAPGEVSTGEVGTITQGTVINSKKRKSPSPGAIEDPAAGSALGSGTVNVRRTLRELPLFSTLPPDILHQLGLSAQPKTYSPFTDIVQQGSAGNEIFFIVRGEAEVIRETQNSNEPFKKTTRATYLRPRLKAGQYFGEVASLGLSEGRTATVRAITTVECLMIPGDALDTLWSRCPPDIKSQVEETARKRYKTSDEDVEMADTDPRERPSKSDPPTPTTPSVLPHMTFTTPSKPASPTKDDGETMEPKDPDPFLSVDMENMRNRRRNSLAPPTPQSDTSSSIALNGFRAHHVESTPLRYSMPQSPPDSQAPVKRARTLPSRPHSALVPALPDDMLVAVFRYLDIAELMRARLVSHHWRRLLSTHPKVCLDLDLSGHNRRVTDLAIKTAIAPFAGTRPEAIDISNCFHITDDGFRGLWESCGRNVKRWRMRSVWDVSANQILDMAENAKGLEEIDWSNCRKVGDNLLARVVGWVVPEPPPPQAPSKQVVISSSTAKSKPQKAALQQQAQQQHRAAAANIPKPGTIIGCPALKHLNLSYCKHITDRSMAHLAGHASNRLETLYLTRCTSITDAGFQSWANFRFLNLSHLCLADCTYLSDNAIVALVGAAKNLTHLDLSFCCALSDTATEVVALGLPQLRELRLAFCGSAVSDASLQSVALHLNELEGISVRGCVRVTGGGVENLLEGCGRIQWVDVSQCRNLESWIRTGGVMRWGFDERGGNGLLAGQVPLPLPHPSRTTNHVGLGGRPLSFRRRTRTPVRFIVEKGSLGLR